MLMGSMVSVLHPVVESGGSGIGSTVVSVLGIFMGFTLTLSLMDHAFTNHCGCGNGDGMPRICTAIILMYHGEISLTHMALPHKPPSYFMW